MDGGVGGAVSAAAAARTGSGVGSVGGAQARDPPVSVRTRRDPMADSVGGAATVSAWRLGIYREDGSAALCSMPPRESARAGGGQRADEGSQDKQGKQTRVHKTNRGSPQQRAKRVFIATESIITFNI